MKKFNTTACWDNDFDRMFDEAVEALEAEAQLIAEWEEQEANRYC